MKRAQFLTEFIEAALNCTVSKCEFQNPSFMLTCKQNGFFGPKREAYIHVFMDRSKASGDTYIRFKYPMGWICDMLLKQPRDIITRGQNYLSDCGFKGTSSTCFIYSPRIGQTPTWAQNCQGIEIATRDNYPWNLIK